MAVPAACNTDASASGGEHMPASAAPRFGDLCLPVPANTDAGLHGGPAEAFARMAVAAAPRFGDASVSARANTDAGLHGGPAEAFARMAMSAVHSSAKFSARPLVERVQASVVTDTEVRHKRKRTLHLLPMAPCSSPPKLNLYGDNNGSGKARKTSASAFSHDYILIE